MDATAWCPDCNRRQTIEETTNETVLANAREYTIWVVHLTCGHNTQTPVHDTPATDGAPYAGPRVAVAKSTNPRHLRHARDRQLQLDADPWADTFPGER